MHFKPLLPALAVITLAACGSGSGPSNPTGSTASPQVAGSYTVAVQLTNNACGPVTVGTQPTSVAHSPGATAFTLTHGGLQLSGSVARDGAFTTQALAVQDPQGPATLALAGRFTTGGLEATATVDVQRPAPAGACRYQVAWSGTKQGAPNVIG